MGKSILLRSHILILIMTVIPVRALSDEHRPFEQMNGGCDNYSLDLKKEFSAWARAADSRPAATSASEALTLALGKKISAGLHPHSKVEFVATPAKSFADPKTSNAGIFRLQIAEDGIYRVAVGERIWFDLVDQDTAKVLDASRFEMQVKCDKIFKAVEFQLRAGGHYLLQLSSVRKPKVDVLLTKIIQ